MGSLDSLLGEATRARLGDAAHYYEALVRHHTDALVRLLGDVALEDRERLLELLRQVALGPDTKSESLP